MRFMVVALGISFALCALILAKGSYLTRVVDIEPGSIIFQLWPFNWIYLRQFATSYYSASEIKWFFTVVSCSNLVWLSFFVWKFFFELLRRDFAFPAGKTPFLTKAAIRAFILPCGIFVMALFANRRGFDGDYHGVRGSLFSLSIQQSIAVGAAKVILALMAFLYFFAAFFLEYGGFALRYLLSKMFGFFVAQDDAEGG